MDDVLDFNTSPEQAGKPTFVDMRLGLATAPVLLAAQEVHSSSSSSSSSTCSSSSSSSSSTLIAELSWSTVLGGPFYLAHFIQLCVSSVNVDYCLFVCISLAPVIIITTPLAVSRAVHHDEEEV